MILACVRGLCVPVVVLWTVLHTGAAAQPNRHLGDLVGVQAPAMPEVQAAWDTALDQAWARPAWDAQAPPGKLPAGAGALPQRPGFWRLPHDRLAVQPVLQHDAPAVLALPLALKLTLEVPGHAVPLDCQPVSGAWRWENTQPRRMWCTSVALLPATAWPALADARLRWHAPVPADGGALDAWVGLLAGRPPSSLVTLLDRNAHCRDQRNCRQGRMPTTEELRQQHLEMRAREPEVRARMALDRERSRQADRWKLLAAAVGGFGVYVLVARAIGATAASVLVVLLSLGASVVFFGEARTASGWGALGMLILALVSIGWGLLLAVLYGWLYRRFLRP